MKREIFHDLILQPSPEEKKKKNLQQSLMAQSLQISQITFSTVPGNQMPGYDFHLAIKAKCTRAKWRDN